MDEVAALKEEIARLKAERDETDAELYRLRMRLTEERRALNDLNEGHKVQEDRAALAEARLDKALAALRDIWADAPLGQEPSYVYRVARAAIAEIEGEAT